MFSIYFYVIPVSVVLLPSHTFRAAVQRECLLSLFIVTRNFPRHFEPSSSSPAYACRYYRARFDLQANLLTTTREANDTPKGRPPPPVCVQTLQPALPWS